MDTGYGQLTAWCGGVTDTCPPLTLGLPYQMHFIVALAPSLV